MVSDALSVGCQVFSEYYQIGGNDQPHEAETEPRGKAELTSHLEGSHSPFGLAWQVASATGWSLHHILWKIPYPVLLMMTMDAPRYVKNNQNKKRKRINALEFFQTRLKEDGEVEKRNFD